MTTESIYTYIFMKINTHTNTLTQNAIGLSISLISTKKKAKSFKLFRYFIISSNKI